MRKCVCVCYPKRRFTAVTVMGWQGRGGRGMLVWEWDKSSKAINRRSNEMLKYNYTNVFRDGFQLCVFLSLSHTHTRTHTHYFSQWNTHTDLFCSLASNWGLCVSLFLSFSRCPSNLYDLFNCTQNPKIQICVILQNWRFILNIQSFQQWNSCKT